MWGTVSVTHIYTCSIIINVARAACAAKHMACLRELACSTVVE